jgi:hypothetical protein
MTERTERSEGHEGMQKVGAAAARIGVWWPAIDLGPRGGHMQPGAAFPGGDAQPFPPQNAGPFAVPVSGAASGPAAAGSVPDERGRRLRLGDLLAVVGGLAVVLCSFAPFVRYSSTFVEQAQSEDKRFTGEYTAWSGQMFMAPLTWFVVIAGLLVVVLAVARARTGRDPLVLGARASVVQVGLALFAVFVLIGYALSHKQTLFGLDALAAGDNGIVLFAERPALSWGGWLMLLGALVATVGAVLNHFNAGPTFRAETRRSRDQRRRNAGPGYPTPPVGDVPPTS